ncbi:MAG: FAD-dependent oxidoreductase [Actinomycetota bacterium]|nr:FAD-dependent oxidoreductase [Actinomycetota bacterium]
MADPISRREFPYRSPDIDIRAPEKPFPLSRGAAERQLRRVDRYDRRAAVTAYEKLNAYGTVRITFQVTDDQPFEFRPGYFIGIQADVPDVGVRRSPYCIVSSPNAERTFQLLVRLVPEGPLSYYLAELGLGDEIAFRGPSGRSMAAKVTDEELVLIATGVGVGPLVPFVDELGAQGFDRPVNLYWGLRLVEDICLTDELDDLVGRYPFFRYQISLTQPPEDWTGLRGRVTETVPPLVSTLSGKRYYLIGNGAMIEEMSNALSDLGVDRKHIYEEVYFNVRYRADPAVVTAIRERFTASDLFAPHAHISAGLFLPEKARDGT